MSDEYADWDGAYVMGSLSRAERLEFEAHLATCARCSEAVADLGVLPGLLARPDADSAELLTRPMVAEAPAEPLMPPVVDRPWWRRSSSRLRLGLALAAAVVVAMAVVVPLAARDHHPAPTVAVALHQTRPSSLSADVDLTTVGWGTRVDLTCVYAAAYGESAVQRPYALYVVDRSGHAQLVSRWHAGPGDTARTTGSTDLSVADIASVQLRSGDGTVLLDARLPAASAASWRRSPPRPPSPVADAAAYS